jgi:hypothetical protein
MRGWRKRETEGESTRDEKEEQWKVRGQPGHYQEGKALAYKLLIPPSSFFVLFTPSSFPRFVIPLSLTFP